jgi:outer membrane protein TolC
VRRSEAILLAACVLLLAGCATSALDVAPASPDTPWTPATRADGEIIAGERAPRTAPRSETYVLPSNRALSSRPAARAQLDFAHAYTLPELIDIAQSRNPATRIAWEDARNAALAAGIASATYLPNLSATVAGAYQTANNGTSTLGIPIDNKLSSSGAISALSLQWLLFDFGERAALVSAARQGSAAANIAFTAAHQQVIYKVSLAFYAYSASRARVSTAEQALKNAQDIEAAAQARFTHGIGTSVEVAQAHQGTAQARLAQVQAAGQAQDSYMALISAMGISPLTEIKIADIPHRKLAPSLAEPVQQIVSEALARRPDVLAAYSVHEASVAKLRAAQAEFLPKLFLSATGSHVGGGFAGVTSLPGIGEQTPTLNVGATHLGATVLLGVSIPLYDGGTRRALESQARSDVAKTDAALEEVRDEATRQIVAAGNGVKTSLATLDASEALAAAAQVTFDAALDAYRHDVGSITDVTRAETGLLEARNAASDAYSTALGSAATLALAVGTLGAAPQ